MGRLRFFWEFGWLVLSFFIVLGAWLAAGWATAQAQSQFQPQAYGPGWNPYQQMSAQPVANKPRTVVVGVDLSQSNPLVRDDDFARRVAERIRPVIASLAPRSRVRCSAWRRKARIACCIGPVQLGEGDGSA